MKSDESKSVGAPIEVLVPRPEPSMSMFANKQDYETARSEWAVQRPAGEGQWISVTERLPEMDVPVFAVDDRQRLVFRVRGWDSDGWYWCNPYNSMYHDGKKWVVTEAEMDDDYTVTHWMDLPRAPSAQLPELVQGASGNAADARSDEKKEGQEGLQGLAIEDRARQLRKFVEEIQAGKWRGAEARRVATMVLAYVDHGTGVEPDAAIREQP